MPRPSVRFPARTTQIPHPRRYLHTSPSFKAGIPEQNHYETLQIPVNATPGEVKKSFYALSKIHHPDHNPSDPSAAQRFHKLTQAYHILSEPSSRQQYDRETFRQTSRQAPERPSGSYHSTSQPGGRSPSGLSRRRSQFRGPPPSFYRSGGWGEHSAKRKNVQGSPSHSQQSQASPTSPLGGMGVSYGFDDDVPHFDREGHFRTGENVRKRRESMVKASSNPKANLRGWEEVQGAGDAPPTLWESLAGVGLIIGIAIGIPVWWFERRMRTAQSWGRGEK